MLGCFGMVSFKGLIATCSVVALGACAVAPQGPTVTAMPGQGKSFEAFQQDDSYCRQAASYSIGNPAAVNQAASNNAAGSALAGTALGAATGAIIGAASGGTAATGAAIGAGAGLLAGSLAGASSAQATGADAQFRYDNSYAQCMFSRGNTVAQPQPVYAAGPAPVYGYGYAAGPAVVVAPPVVVAGPVWVPGGWYGGYWHGGYWRR